MALTKEDKKWICGVLQTTALHIMEAHRAISLKHATAVHFKQLPFHEAETQASIMQSLKEKLADASK